MDRGAWQATYSPWGRTESDTTQRLSAHELATRTPAFLVKQLYVSFQHLQVSVFHLI